MFKKGFALWALWAVAGLVSNAQIGTGQWRIHLPFNNTQGIAETPRYVYTWSSFGFYRFDKEANGSESLSKIQGFSDVAVSCIRYYQQKDILLVGYQDGNLDLVQDGQIININDIKRSTINGLKIVNNIFYEGDFAYIACTFGVVLLDLNRLEVTAYKELNIGDISDVVLWNNKVYAATDKGIYTAPLTGANLKDPSSWTQLDTGATRQLTVFDNKLFAIRTNGINYLSGTIWSTIAAPGYYYSFFSTGDKLLVGRRDTLLTIEKSLAIKKQFINTLKGAIQSTDGSIWYTTDNNGTLHMFPGGALQFTQPNGPYNLSTGLMASLDDEVIVAGGTIGGNFNFTYSLNGYYRHKEDRWINSLEKSNPITDTLRDFYAIATDPKTKDVWLGAYWQGLVKMNNGVVQDVFTQRNSTIKLNAITFISGMAVDNSGHLWISNYGSDSALVVRTNKGEWASIALGNLKNVSQMVVDEKNRKWIVTPRSSGYGLVVYDDNKTPLNPNDDIGPKFLSTNVGQGALPDNQVNCIAIDRDGEIWAGTLKGPVVFSNPSNILSSKPSDGRQIVIGEGTDIGYLLGNEVINSIYIDGGNRKWMGTNNGAWLISADGQTILANFNTENSPMFSNSVMQVTVNEKTGEVFFATDRGIISYKGDATKAEKTHKDVLVFPNPVREDYDGLISIRGLAEDANVKITDISGSLIYETRANGGMATWNGRSFNGRKASTGVYLIFSGTDDASDTYVAKVLVVNGGK